MKHLSDHKKEELINFLLALKEGDSIKFNGVKLALYNSSGNLIYVVSIND